MECCTLGKMSNMAAPIGQHGKYLFWLQLLNRLSDFHTVFTDGLRKRSRLYCDQGDWCHSSPLRLWALNGGRGNVACRFKEMIMSSVTIFVVIMSILRQPTVACRF